MPNYNVTVSTEFTTEVTANSPEEAARSMELISNDENEIILNVLRVEEIIPPSPSGYTSLRDFHRTPSRNESNEYSRFCQTESTPTYIRFSSSLN